MLPKLTYCSVSTGNGQPSITLYDSTLDFKVDDEEHMRIIPPTLFVRLRQEMAASRINKLLYSANSHRFAEGAATSYMSLEADRLKEERVKEENSSLDGVDSGTYDTLIHWDVSDFKQAWKNYTTTPSPYISICTRSSARRYGSNGGTTLSRCTSLRQPIWSVSLRYNTREGCLTFPTTLCRWLLQPVLLCSSSSIRTLPANFPRTRVDNLFYKLWMH